MTARLERLRMPLPESESPLIAMGRPVPYVRRGSAVLSGWAAHVYAALGARDLPKILEALPPDDGRRDALLAAQEALERADEAWQAEATTSDPRSPAVADAAIEAPSAHDEPDQISTTEAAVLIGVKERRVLQMIDEKLITGHQRRRGTPWRIDRASVLAYRQERQEHAA